MLSLSRIHGFCSTMALQLPKIVGRNFQTSNILRQRMALQSFTTSKALQQKKIKLVLLDNSGTTNDCGVYAPAVVFIDVFKKHGIEISMEEARIPMGMFKKDHIREILKLPGVGDRFEKVKGKQWKEDDVVEMFADFIPMQMACLDEYAALIPGAKETAELIRKEFGVLIGSTTGFAKEMNDVLLSRAKEQGYFPDVYTSSSDVERGRPHRFMVEENMRQAGITDPNEVLKVGDTKMDMQEAKALAEVRDDVPWTLGLATTGNYVAKTWEEIVATKGDDLISETLNAELILHAGGADYIANTIRSLPRVIEVINDRLERGEKPRKVELDYLK